MRAGRDRRVLAVVASALVAILVLLLLAAPSLSETAVRDRDYCGSFSYSGLDVRVYRVRGGIKCERLRHVMKRHFNGNSTGRWDCIGPQTGYAACERDRHKMVAKF
jgi:hypothetical protein